MVADTDPLGVGSTEGVVPYAGQNFASCVTPIPTPCPDPKVELVIGTFS